MAFDIPRVSGAIQPNKIPDDTQLVAALAKQILAARLAQARAAAGGGGRRSGGRSKSGTEKVTYANVLDPKTGKYVQVPITGNSKDERKANLQALQHNQTVDSVRADPALSRLAATMNDPKASNKTKQETLTAVRKELNQKYGGSDDASAIIFRELSGANNQVKTEKKAIDDTSGFSSLIDSARIGAESLSNWISTIGDDDKTRDRKDQESQQRIQAIIDSNPDLKETELRTKEGRGLTDRNDDFMGTARNMVNTMVQDPGTALQTIGTGAGILGASALTGGVAAAPLASLAGGVLAGAAGNAVSGDVGLRQRLAEDESLNEDQRIAAYNDAKYREAAMNAAIGGVSGVVPAAVSRIGAGLIRSGTGAAGREARSMAEEVVDKTLNNKAIARKSADVAEEVVTDAEKRQMVNQVMREETAPYIIQRDVLNHPVKYGVVPSMTEGAASNALNTMGSNANYNAATGQNNDITNGIGESALYGGAMAGIGGAMGVAGRHILSRNAAEPEAPEPTQYNPSDFQSEKLTAQKLPVVVQNPVNQGDSSAATVNPAPVSPQTPDSPQVLTAPEARLALAETPAAPINPVPGNPIAMTGRYAAPAAPETPNIPLALDEAPAAPANAAPNVPIAMAGAAPVPDTTVQRGASAGGRNMFDFLTPEQRASIIARETAVQAKQAARQNRTTTRKRKARNITPVDRNGYIADILAGDNTRNGVIPLTQDSLLDLINNRAAAVPAKRKSQIKKAPVSLTQNTLLDVINGTNTPASAVPVAPVPAVKKRTTRSGERTTAAQPAVDTTLTQNTLLDVINGTNTPASAVPVTAGKRTRNGNKRRNTTDIQRAQSASPDGIAERLREGTINTENTDLNSAVAANTANIAEPASGRGIAETGADSQRNTEAGSGGRPNENTPAPENYTVNAGEQGSTAGRPEPADRGRGTESATVRNAESGQSTGSLGTERSTGQRSLDTGEKPKPLTKVQRQKMHDSLQEYFSSTGTGKLSNEQAADMINSLFLRQDEAASSAVKSAPNLTSLIYKRGQYTLGRKASKSITQMFPKEVGDIIADRMNRYKESNGQDTSALFTAEDVDNIKYFSDMVQGDAALNNKSADTMSPEKMTVQNDKTKEAFNGDNPCIS